MNFRTTHVGSWPRTQVLQAAQQDVNRESPNPDFDQILDSEVRKIIQIQVQTGVEEVNDGEYRRSIYFGDITGLPGFKQEVYPIEFSAGDVYRTPVVERRIEYDPSIPFTAREVTQVKGILEDLGVDKRVKVTIPSLSHMLPFYPDPTAPGVSSDALPFLEALHEQVEPDYPTVQDYLEHVRQILLNEARAAIDAGVDSIQFDSPDLMAFLTPAMTREEVQEVTRQRVELNNSLLAYLPPEMLEIHSCWGNFVSTQINTLGSLNGILPELYELKAGTIGPLEVFDGLRDFEELVSLKEYPLPRGKNLALGIVSVKTRNVEPVEVLRRRYQAATEVVDADKLIVSSGCGFASGITSVISLESATRKLANLVKAVNPDSV